MVSHAQVVSERLLPAIFISPKLNNVIEAKRLELEKFKEKEINCSRRSMNNDGEELSYFIETEGAIPPKLGPEFLTFKQQFVQLSLILYYKRIVYH